MTYKTNNGWGSVDELIETYGDTLECAKHIVQMVMIHNIDNLYNVSADYEEGFHLAISLMKDYLENDKKK